MKMTSKQKYLAGLEEKAQQEKNARQEGVAYPGHSENRYHNIARFFTTFRQHPSLQESWNKFRIEHELQRAFSDAAISDISTFNRLYITYPSIQGNDDSTMLTNIIRCTSKGPKTSERFDYALVDTKRKSGEEALGMDGLAVAQLRLIFRVHSVKEGVEPLELAYVEWFKTGRPYPTKSRRTGTYQAVPATGMFEVSRMTVVDGASGDLVPRSSVIYVGQIVRAVHLIPHFGSGPTGTMSWQERMEKSSRFYLNNFIDQHMYNSIYDFTKG
jgi:hypothetical protein